MLYKNHGAMCRLHGKRSAVCQVRQQGSNYQQALRQLRPAARKNTGKLRRVFLVGSPDDTSERCGSSIEAWAERELRGVG